MGQMSMFFACLNGNIKKVKEIIEDDCNSVNWVNLNGVYFPLLLFSSFSSYLPSFLLVHFFLFFSWGGTPLHTASIENRVELVKLLLLSKSNINAQDEVFYFL